MVAIGAKVNLSSGEEEKRIVSCPQGASELFKRLRMTGDTLLRKDKQLEKCLLNVFITQGYCLRGEEISQNSRVLF